MGIYEKHWNNSKAIRLLIIGAVGVMLAVTAGCGHDAPTRTGEALPPQGPDAPAPESALEEAPTPGDDGAAPREQIAACIDRVAPELHHIVEQMVAELRRDTEGLSAFDPQFSEKLAEAQERRHDPEFVAATDKMEQVIRAECF